MTVGTASAKAFCRPGAEPAVALVVGVASGVQVVATSTTARTAMPVPVRRVRAGAARPRAVEIHRAAPCRWLSAQAFGGGWYLPAMLSNPRSLHITQLARSCWGGRDKTWRGDPRPDRTAARSVRGRRCVGTSCTTCRSTPAIPTQLTCWSTAYRQLGAIHLSEQNRRVRPTERAPTSARRVLKTLGSETVTPRSISSESW
jgi:hypothetical protein